MGRKTLASRESRIQSVLRTVIPSLSVSNFFQKLFHNWGWEGGVSVRNVRMKEICMCFRSKIVFWNTSLLPRDLIEKSPSMRIYCKHYSFPPPAVSFFQPPSHRSSHDF